ncbi:PLC-like phosphodiesterase [Apodospora peruviana]|uniref:PLC-like phosphodiesterase n=1 Tax=Apodospora peruviana TaxID=516989 RepID=A0AAE0IBT7_9PEZI|nr:PLC-like phosphodiesterase [Apodospora peruviana]
MAAFLWLVYLVVGGLLLPGHSLSSLAEAAAVANNDGGSSQLGNFALQKILADSSEVFGDGYTRSGSSNKMKNINRAEWMKRIPDSTPLTQLNIPGTHDSATWNFTQATSDAILHNTDPANDVYPAAVYQCQRVSILAALNGGIRFFDLRYGFDPTGVRLVFWHAHALLSELATVQDVLFGVYAWLEEHKSEVVILSLKAEETGVTFPPGHATPESLLVTSLTTPAARQYILQRHDSLGQLGPARGKVILFRRFDTPTSLGGESKLPGLHLSPSTWPDNGKAFSLLYNPAKNLSAHIEDYYEPNDLPEGQKGNASVHIAAKLASVEANLQLAAANRNDDDVDRDGLFVTFTSAEHNANVPPILPVIMALGNGTDVTPLGGVNRRLVKEVLPKLQGKRLGVLVIDFWDEPADLDLVGTILGL